MSGDDGRRERHGVPSTCRPGKRFMCWSPRSSQDNREDVTDFSWFSMSTFVFRPLLFKAQQESLTACRKLAQEREQKVHASEEHHQADNPVKRNPFLHQPKQHLLLRAHPFGEKYEVWKCHSWRGWKETTAQEKKRSPGSGKAPGRIYLTPHHAVPFPRTHPEEMLPRHEQGNTQHFSQISAFIWKLLELT